MNEPTYIKCIQLPTQGGIVVHKGYPYRVETCPTGCTKGIYDNKGKHYALPWLNALNGNNTPNLSTARGGVWEIVAPKAKVG